MTPATPSQAAGIDVSIPVAGAVLAGTLSYLPGKPRPGVMLIGGTFSDLRDGDADPRDRPDIPPHGMYRVLADGLVAAGFAVLRFDRRGCGTSTGERPTRAQEVDDAAAAWRWLDSRHDVAGAAVMVGESAGAYVLCRLAVAGLQPRAAVLQGALHRSIAGLIEFNGSRSRAFHERGADARAWMWENARHEYESAVLHEATLAALAAGRVDDVIAADERGSYRRALAGLAYDLEFPPADQFAALRCPVLILHGGDDLNVPVEDAFATARTLWAAGNRAVDMVILSAADHSMQRTPVDDEQRLRERMDFTSFREPYHPRYPAVIVEYLASALGGQEGIDRGPA